MKFTSLALALSLATAAIAFPQHPIIHTSDLHETTIVENNFEWQKVTLASVGDKYALRVKQHEQGSGMCEKDGIKQVMEKQ
jgi:hypothetical protein